MGIRYSALPGHTTEMSEAMDEALSKKWRELRGIAIASFAVATVSASEEDEQMIKHLQKKAVYRDPSMAAASLVGAQGEAMVGAAKNTGAFCTECGTKKPAGAKLYRCDMCGWEPEDPAHPPKFCPECGDPFDDNDARS